MNNNARKNPLLKLESVSKSFTNPEGQDLLVLDNINLNFFDGEIIALVGKSGSGKSTLLRMIAGLTAASSGNIYYRNQQVKRPIPNIAVVFQNFALMPWLTVLENVELGLEAQGVPHEIRRKRALSAIDTIGLDGFESAYPKELSGGMRQRVGFARAIVVEPELLIMDEPFSSLDVLTAENLRNDLIDLWVAERTKTRAIILVTHDIEEAISMADRVIIFASDPGRVQADLHIDLKLPRDPKSAAFEQLVDKVYAIMTTSERKRIAQNKQQAAAYRLPEVSVSELTGLLEAMEPYQKAGAIDLPELAESLHLDVNNLFPLTEALDMLRLITITQGKVTYTEAGKKFADADILQRKQLFAKHLVAHIPLAKQIRTLLDHASNNKITEDIVSDELENHLSEDEAAKILKIIIDWGRYAEIFAYDYDSGILSLENPQ